jgi:hypothetical protein
MTETSKCLIEVRVYGRTFTLKLSLKVFKSIVKDVRKVVVLSRALLKMSLKSKIMGIVLSK